ncbi:unnamed protein product [Rotaria sp. Silwood1]|nr:unnamed protein product [Rotaria sp. Silwood1]CAF1639826.1 unnamed protein product [Rotaria sp. Silwood1]CAF5000049.1 unnamed protein product [Rotaria sp. Silwood1]
MVSLTNSQAKLIDDDIKSNKDRNGNYICMFCKVTIDTVKKNCIKHMKQRHPKDVEELIKTRMNIRQAQHEGRLEAAAVLDAALENVDKEDDDDDDDSIAQYTSNRMDNSVMKKDDDEEQIKSQLYDFFKKLKKGSMSEEQYLASVNALLDE